MGNRKGIHLMNSKTLFGKKWRKECDEKLDKAGVQ